ncbi:hypothetical protein SAMN05421776_108214 [Nocardia farcinica]|uniref:Head-to-tail adaptor n=1 Tax=Nocardia farcinica TaxID=37329 RepID=A0A0H5NU80_NOCFR|nr:hypothetical protein CJ469_01936 [Nocardia farcinica]PFX10220.1 hypothetical protein CJ468_01067 [Nocardia farcinica]CRY73576.1 Uncharacterised protein [Nocardia farcinica]SIT29628.1 hypothetical protein SAMN05421776_108214 [Nocardia farcinica]
MSAPCTWPVDYTCLPDVEAPEDVAILQQAVDTAVAVLWSFTGRQYGCCPRIVRPCPRDLDGPRWFLPGWSWFPELDGGVWRNISCSCGPTCRAGGPGVVHLPGPVCSVTSVTIDGAVIPSSAYVLEGDRLYSAVGEWPDQDLTRPAGSPGTWTVEYLQGQQPPAGAGMAVALLAKEFWSACRGEACALPKRVEQIARRGVSVRMADPAVLFEHFQTGIAQVDMWVAAVNPHRLSAPGAVSSPDFEG